MQLHPGWYSINVHFHQISSGHCVLSLVLVWVAWVADVAVSCREVYSSQPFASCAAYWRESEQVHAGTMPCLAPMTEVQHNTQGISRLSPQVWSSLAWRWARTEDPLWPRCCSRGYMRTTHHDSQWFIHSTLNMSRYLQHMRTSLQYGKLW
jgi:hypothetical protein